VTPPSDVLDERLPAPKLDDRRFQDLVDEAKRRIQQTCPEWTDHNVSDPGVTLVEAFAWMTDQLLYRLNRVPDLNYVKFLELLGVTLLPPTAARTDLTFRLSKAPENGVAIPAGTQVSSPRSATGEQITFSTAAPLSIPPCSAIALASIDPLGRVHPHDAAEPIVCFSDPPQPGDSFLVGLNPAVPSCTVKLYLPCRQGSGGGIDPANAPVAWDARVGDDAGALSLWDGRTRELLRRFSADRGQPLRCLAFSPDGHMLASAGEGTIQLRDAHDPDHSGQRLEGHEGPVHDLTFSRDGRMLASGGDDGTVRLWDVHRSEHQPQVQQARRRLDGHKAAVFAVTFSPNGQTLASAGADGTVRLWNVEKEEPARRTWDVHERLETVVVKADTERRGEDRTVTRVRRRCVVGVAFLDDGRELAAAGDDGALWLWSLREPAVPGDEQAPQERRLNGYEGPVFGAAFSPDGQTLATAGADGKVWLSDVHQSDQGPRTQNGRRRLDGHEGPVFAVSFSLDGQTLATVGADWTARLWDVTTGDQLHRPLSDHCPVHAAAFHPKGRIVATAGLDGAWERCEVESDDTRGFNEPGHVVLHVPAAHSDATVGGTSAAWLRCRVRAHEERQKTYDKSPVLEVEIGGNTLTAETSGGTVAAMNAEAVHDELLGIAEGVAGQRFLLDRRPVVPLPANEKHVLEVHVGMRIDEWHEVTSFAEAAEDEPCFVLDHVAGAVVLGPTIRERPANGPSSETHRRFGAVPPKGAELRLRKYLTGGGRRGNVSERMLTVLRTPIANVSSVVNRRRASGGVDGEDIENAKLRGPITLRTANRAVTPEDYERLAREAAPELARVECIPATDEAHAGEARVLVIPKVESDDGELLFEQLAPSVDMVDRITSYLDQRRVIGARVLVTPPHYHGITIAAKLLARHEFDAKDVKERALDALYREFSPISGGRDGKGWEFGRPVLQGDVYAVLQSVSGVDRVDDCRVFEANPITGERTPLPATATESPGEPPKIEVPVSRYATIFSYRHYVFVAGQ
jgi:predicted phage baseplate assembly protein